MADYKGLYFFLFGVTERAIRLLEKSLQAENPASCRRACERAAGILVGAQQVCEELILEDPAPPIRLAAPLRETERDAPAGEGPDAPGPLSPG